jgi:hypothetical protein
MSLAGHVAQMGGGDRKAYRVLVEEPERKRPLERLRRNWKDNIQMHLREIRWSGIDWIHLVRDRDQ